MLLVAQCNALSNAMPFLFERIDDETELLLADNLLRTDSIIAKLVAAIPEEDWQEVEIIGWLYQFYISEKKDEVIGKVVKSEDIPAATQLFTPNWIVQYLVQNSVGRLWLMANPASTLASQWPYYIQPAEQTPEVQAQLDALIQTRIQEDSPRPQAGEGVGERAGGALNPETITVLDPACGSGHILVVAYDVLKAIYLERGYQLRAIPRLILEKNLYGLDIDDRAAQMAGFALLMKARADDRRLFDNPPKLNVLALQESKGLDADELTITLQGRVDKRSASTLAEGDGGCAALIHPTIAALIDTFEHAKTFGSLIQIPPELNAQLSMMTEGLQQAIQNGDLYAKAAAQDLLPLVQQAQVLGMQFDAVVANPPYMGGKGMNAEVKDFAKKHFSDSKSDLFAMFIERGFGWCKLSGFNSMVTMQSWMFLSSFEAMREKLLADRTIMTMAHFGARAFSEISGEVVQTTAFVLQGQHFGGFKPVFFRLVEGQETDKEQALKSGRNRHDVTAQDEFKKIPGSPVAYWVSQSGLSVFTYPKLYEIGKTRRGLQTGDKARFIRYWFECDTSKTEFRYLAREKAISSPAKWFMFNNGGDYRKWYGNMDLVVNWEGNGNEIKAFSGAIVPSEELYFLPAIAWPRIATGQLGFRMHPEGVIPGDLSPCYYADDLDIAAGFLNSKCCAYLLDAINPTITSPVGDVAKIPFPELSLDQQRTVKFSVQRLIEIHRDDWNAVESSWDFKSPMWISTGAGDYLELVWADGAQTAVDRLAQAVQLEEDIAQVFVNACNLRNEVTTEILPSEITLARADREKDCQRLISYAIGCMMGRYSLDEPGLIYAHAANVGFDATRYQTFPADADGIVPLTDDLWFEDDAANRIREFLLAVWGAETLEENMSWLAESLGKKGNETPEETIRRYLSGSFFKDHCSTYKKRPIYWLFSSGKQGAFQALVYLHRYHEGTLARMRSEYVVPLTGKIQSRIEMLTKDAEAATVTAARNKLNKEIESLRKKHVELLSYDEKLRHYADMRITLDLDDGVKVNYGKFGDLLAEVKAVTGGASDG